MPLRELPHVQLLSRLAKEGSFCFSQAYSMFPTLLSSSIHLSNQTKLVLQSVVAMEYSFSLYSYIENSALICNSYLHLESTVTVNIQSLK